MVGEELGFDEAVSYTQRGNRLQQEKFELKICQSNVAKHSQILRIKEA